MRLSGIVFLGGLVIAGGHANALSLHATADPSDAPGVECFNAVAAGTATCSYDDGQHIAHSTVEAGSITLDAFSLWPANLGSFLRQTTAGGIMSGTVRFDDPGDPGGVGTTSVTLPLDLTGSCAFAGADYVGNICEIFVEVTIGTQSLDGDWRWRETTGLEQNDGLLAAFTTTALAGQISASFANVPINTDLLFEVAFEVEAIAGDTVPQTRSSATHMDPNTLSFATGGPVFTGLDGGITVNSPDFMIADNVWQSGTTVMPEPGMLGLFGVGLAGLGLALRRRKMR